jgi:hypothetical protein
MFLPVGALVRSALAVTWGVPTVAAAEAVAEYVAGHIKAHVHHVSDSPSRPPERH